MRRGNRNGEVMPWWSAPRTLTTQLFLFDFVECFAIDTFIGCRAGLKPTNANFYAAGFAEAVIVLGDGFYGVVNFFNQLSLSIPGSQLEAKFFFLCCAVCWIGIVCGVVLHMMHSSVDFLH